MTEFIERLTTQSFCTGTQSDGVIYLSRPVLPKMSYPYRYNLKQFNSRMRVGDLRGRSERLTCSDRGGQADLASEANRVAPPQFSVDLGFVSRKCRFGCFQRP